jgi:uncharacterized iron-regulated membrane protein
MRTDVLRTYKTLHTWTGLLSGLLLFIAFYAGALAVFKPALTHWASSPTSAQVTRWDLTDHLIAEVLEASPDAQRQLTVHLGSEQGASHPAPARITWDVGPHDEEDTFGALLTKDGRLETFPIETSSIGQFIDDIHRTGGLPVDVELGAAIMGVVSGLYALALVSGVIILFPSLIKDLFALRISQNVKRMWLDSHNIIGLFSLPFHLIIAITSVVFGLHDFMFAALDQVVFEGTFMKTLMAENPFRAVAPNPTPAQMMPIDALLAQVKALAPGFTPDSLIYLNGGTQGASVAVTGYDDRYFMAHRGILVLDALNGAVVNSDYMPAMQGTYGAIFAALLALHMASFGGPAVEWGYLLLGLGGAFLFYSGNLLWIESRRRREKRSTGPRTQKASTHWMACLTLGVCLGCIIGLSLCLVLAKMIQEQEGLYGTLYGLFGLSLLGAFGWAIWRGPGRAGADLLWASTASTLAVPLISVLGWAFPGLGLWTWGNAWGIDACALVGGLIFALIARRASQRAREGARDSVWAENPSQA